MAWPAQPEVAGVDAPVANDPLASQARRRRHGQMLEQLRAILPAHMVPAAVVEMPALPSTGNGKLDQGALPAPEYGGLTHGRRPADRQEERVAEIFARTLGAPAVAMDEDFLHVGGNSLLATRLLGRLRAELDLDLDLRSFFAEPTADAVVARLRSVEPVRRPRTAAGPRTAADALSAGQRRMLFLDRLHGGATYNVPLVVHLRGRLDAEALRRGLGPVVARHAVLRTIYPERGGEPRPSLLEGMRAVPTLDPPVEVLPADLGAALAAHEAGGFDLTQEPPWRLRLFALRPDHHVLSIVLHHVACDGWSLAPLVADLGTAYGQAIRGVNNLPVPTLQYTDHVRRQRELLGELADPGSRAAEQAAWWQKTLLGLPAAIRLPADRPRPTGTSPVTAGDHLTFTVDPGLHGRLRDVARRHQVTLFMVFHAALAALYTRLGAGTDIPIGTVVAGRTDPALDPLVGFFVNTLVLRTDTAGNPTFAELLARVRNTDLEAYAHQDLPFDHVVEAVNPPRAAHRHPLFQTMLVLQNTPQPAPVFPGLEAEAVHRFNGFIGAKFDVTITLSERGSHGVNGFDGATEIDGAHGIDGAIGFDGALFDAETVRLLVERWLRLIEALAATPDLQIGWPDLVGDAERTALLAAGCGRSRVVPERSLVELFTEQRRRTPGALAVTDGAARVDYAELDRRSDVLATVLREAGAVPERPVALLQSRGVEHVVSVLAVLKTGAFYVPLPENVPDARCSAILALTAATIVVVDPAHAGAAVLDGVPCVLRSDARPSRQTACPVQAHPDQLAYVMFTSGSTGTPKGVGITHGNIASFATDPRFEPADRERVLMHSPPSFDPSVYEMWVPLLSGGAAVVMPPGPLDPRALGRFIRRQDATSAVFTAEVFMLMAEEATTDLAHLRLAWSGGDVLRPGPVGALLGCGGRVRVANAFGGTESTVISTWQAVDAQLTASGPLPIGTPMDNVRVRVLDGRLRPVPSGVPGDIYLAGHGTARGYHGSPALTAERFHPDPYGPPGSRMYRTGDRGHLDRRHVLHYDDRGDSQVKISGHRVELGEIDAVLARHPDVAVAATVARATARGRMQLVAYTVTAGPLTSALRASIIAHLGSHLPRHMVPTHVVGVPRFPLTANGKVDHRELPAPPEQAVTLGGAVADPVGGADSANTHETALTGLFADVLGQPRFAAHDNFFHHGGHSLLASRLVSRIRSAIGVEVDLNSLFDHPTPAGMARHLNSTEHRAPSRPVLRRRREG